MHVEIFEITVFRNNIKRQMNVQQYKINQNSLFEKYTFKVLSRKIHLNDFRASSTETAAPT